MIGLPGQEDVTMGRPTVFGAKARSRFVLSVLSGETTVVEAARKEKLSEQSVGGGGPSSSKQARLLRGRKARPVGPRNRR
mgnify:FL=1